MDYALKSEQFIQTLEQCLHEKGKPDLIQVDNGSEFTSKALDIWAFSRGIQLHFSRPGKPTDNPLIESFNGRVRPEARKHKHPVGPISWLHSQEAFLYQQKSLRQNEF